MVKISRSTVRVAAYAIATLTLAAIVGCANKVEVPKPFIKSETEIAIESLRGDLLVKCEGVVGPMPENEIGNLLKDYNDVVTVGSICMLKQHALIDVIAPIVAKERARVEK